MLIYFTLFCIFAWQQERWMVVADNEDQIIFARTDLFNTGESIELISRRGVDGFEVSNLRADCRNRKVMRLDLADAMEEVWREVEVWERNRLGVMCQSIPIEEYATFRGEELVEIFSQQWWNIPFGHDEMNLTTSENGVSYYSNPIDEGESISWIYVLDENVGRGYYSLYYSDCETKTVSMAASVNAELVNLNGLDNARILSTIPLLRFPLRDSLMPYELYNWMCGY